MGLSHLGSKARVHQSNAANIFENPEIDVIERKGQRHPDPMDTRGHLNRLTGLRGYRPWEFETVCL